MGESNSFFGWNEMNQKEFQDFIKTLYFTFDILADILSDLEYYIRCEFRGEKRKRILQKLYELCEAFME
jgi:hypothetical protein